jgi:hypothetical protein
MAGVGPRGPVGSVPARPAGGRPPPPRPPQPARRARCHPEAAGARRARAAAAAAVDDAAAPLAGGGGGDASGAPRPRPLHGRAAVFRASFYAQLDALWGAARARGLGPRRSRPGAACGCLRAVSAAAGPRCGGPPTGRPPPPLPPSRAAVSPRAVGALERLYLGPSGWGEAQLVHDHVAFRTFGVRRRRQGGGGGGWEATARLAGAGAGAAAACRPAATGHGGVRRGALQASNHQAPRQRPRPPSLPPLAPRARQVPGLGVDGLGAALAAFGYTRQPGAIELPGHCLTAAWWARRHGARGKAARPRHGARAAGSTRARAPPCASAPVQPPPPRAPRAPAPARFAPPPAEPGGPPDCAALPRVLVSQLEVRTGGGRPQRLRGGGQPLGPLDWHGLGIARLPQWSP